ncbi:MAG TPA: RagB/SusD family nutrient uptake outer membrane protein [Puia sp.]|jgi:hypothetical protein
MTPKIAKNIFLPAVLIIAFFSSCKKDLDQVPISAATSETFYASAQDFLQGTNAVYANLLPYPDRLINLSETRSDNLYAVSVGGVRDWEGINDFSNTITGNPYVEEAWATNFNGIFKANSLIDQLHRNGGVIGSAALQTRYEGEAKFLRAFYYFDLVRWFGKLPIVDHPISGSDALSIGRSAVADVYTLIISDLQFAIANLPASYTGTDKGRATKYAAEGILALVYMTRSAPDYGIEGPGLGSNEWNLALPLLNDIIASPNYSFLSSYNSIFSYTNENNPEVVFDVQYTSGLTPVKGASFIGLLVPDGYFQSLGVVVPGTSNLRPVSNNLLASYEAGDTRQNFSIHNGYIFNGDQETRSFFVKYLDITRIPANQLDWPINFIVLRYTDVLLMKAECVLHGAPGSQTTDVDNVVNKVRGRGGLTTPLVGVTLPQLFEERRKEFASEGTRWHDLVRSGNIGSIMTAWIAADDVQHKIQPFQNNFIIYPIPQSQLDVKPGLFSQNKGY